uniref:Uncharacterized protein n=1 Tax=Strigamia maritima TaxID=126957 RepID=T1IHS3_STRMM
MATTAFNHSGLTFGIDPSGDNEEFLIVDRLDHSLSKFELEAKIFSLREEILFLKSWKNSCEKFQEKFFELFIAFTVLVTPLAIAFVFNYVFSNGNDYNGSRDLVYNCTTCSSEWENFSSPKGTGGDSTPENCVNNADKLCCLMMPPSATTSQHIRDAVVPVLIAISFIVGLPYYYHMLDELSHSNVRIDKTRDESDDDDSGDEGDEEESDTMWEDDDGKERSKMRSEKGKCRKRCENSSNLYGKMGVTVPESGLVNID